VTSVDWTEPPLTERNKAYICVAEVRVQFERNPRLKHVRLDGKVNEDGVEPVGHEEGCFGKSEAGIRRISFQAVVRLGHSNPGQVSGALSAAQMTIASIRQ
jgi:hypothetical protein